MPLLLDAEAKPFEEIFLLEGLVCWSLFGKRFIKKIVC